MRRVFAKEWHQGQMIALFGLLMGGLLTALWGIFTVAYVKDWIDQENVNGFCGAMFYIVPVMLAIFVGAGLFAAEVERGTMPLLLALPFSRRQVWLGKTVAGLALMLSAVAMTIVPGVIATRPALEEVSFWQFAPELALGSALLYFGALFWSTVLTSIVSAFLSAVATGIGLVVWGIVLMVLGGRLFGPPLLDVEVWALAAIPGLIAGSYFGFVRGEAFLGKRRWRMPLAVALAIYLVTMIVLGGLARWSTRYDRALVQKVNAAAVTGDGRAVSFLTYASPVRLTREAEVKLADRPTAGDRRVYSVVLDLNTGKELLVRRETDVATVSPDGEHAILLTEPRPLTWRGEASNWGWPIIEIWDLSRKRMTYRGVPTGPGASGTARVGGMQWSPDSKWLGITVPQWESNSMRVLFLGLDGRVALAINTAGWFLRGAGRDSWSFARGSDAVYALGRGGAVTQYELPGGGSHELWTIAAAGLDAEDWFTQDGSIAVSPNGRHVAVALTVNEQPAHQPRLGPAGRRSGVVRSLIAVFEPGAGGGTVIRFADELTRYRTLVWSGDSTTFYCVSTVGDEWGSARDRVAVWRVGQERAKLVTLPVRAMGAPEVVALADGRLIEEQWKQHWLIGKDGSATRVGGAAGKALTNTHIAGVDKQGRLIVEKWEGEERVVQGVPDAGLASYLAAVDVDSGQLTKVYP